MTQGNDGVTDVGGGANMNGLTNATGEKTSKTAGTEANGYDLRLPDRHRRHRPRTTSAA